MFDFDNFFLSCGDMYNIDLTVFNMILIHIINICLYTSPNLSVSTRGMSFSEYMNKHVYLLRTALLLTIFKRS